MGNCFSFQMTCDTLMGRCWDCTAGQVMYICQLEENLEALQNEREELKALQTDVMQKVSGEEGRQVKILEQIKVWNSSVDAKIALVDSLIADAPQETSKLCLGGCCSKNCKSIYVFGKMVAKRKQDLISLKEKGNFEQVVAKAHVQQLEDNLESLQIQREEVLGLKADVLQRVKNEEGQQKKPLRQVEVWVSRVEDAITDVDALLRDGPQELHKLRTQGCSDSNFRDRVVKRLADLVDLKGKGNFKLVADKGPVEPVVERPSEPTVGLNSMLDKVLRCLMDEEVGIIGLYGMGGVGKTTLLTKINNKFLNIPNDFDLVIWVVVSKDLGLAKVQEEIAKRIGVSIKEWKSKSIDERAMEIFSMLREKKFLLLLDDVWDRVNLAKAGVPLPNKHIGSKIVLTTRSEVVCSQMDTQKRIKVEPLSWEKAWELFKEKIGSEALSIDPVIPYLAKDVARECGGLPLALITIARAMACNKSPEEWRCALNDLRRSASDLQGMTDEVFPLLKYSYDKLSYEKVRSCFLYCALFPEDFKILKDDLISYWICENFWDDEDSEDVARDRGYQIIGTLVYACLLEEAEEGKYVKMHDVIRDMALWIACKREKVKHNFMVRVGAQLTEAPKVGTWKGVTRISLMENSISNLSEVPTCPQLLTLFLCRNPHLRTMNNYFFQFMDSLTVLDLSDTSIQELPTGISNLASLKHLNLSNTCIQRLPCELKMMRNLKYLNLEHNDYLDMISRHVISSLSSLQVLRMFHCCFFFEVTEDNILSDSDMLIEELHHLKHLNVLSFTIRSASAFQKYLSMQKLLSCTRALSLECFGYSKSLDLSWMASMKHLEMLQICGIEHLEEMKSGVGGLYNSVIVTKMCLDRLREVSVEYCSRLRNLKWLIHAPNLAILKVAGCDKVEEIINVDNLGKCVVEEAFARLEILILEDLPKLKSICRNALPLTFLKKMRILDCPSLKKLPLNSRSAKGSKIVIEGEEEWWKGLEWEDEDTEAEFLPFFRSCVSKKRIYKPPYFIDLSTIY